MYDPAVIHRTKFEFPLDRGFYGNTFVIGNLVKNSELYSCVDCFSKDLTGDETLIELNKKVAKTEFGADLSIDPYFPRRMHDLREMKEGSLEHKLDYVGKKIEGESGNLFNFLLDNYLDNRKTVLTTHHLGSDYDNILELKRMMGDMLQPVLYLHCMADFFFKNPGKKSKESERLRHFVEESDAYCVAVSDEVKDSFKNMVDESRIETIRNGVSQELYYPMSRKEKRRFAQNIELDADYTVGYVGRLDSVKGYDYLFDVLKRHNEYNPQNIGFVIASSNGKELDKFLDMSRNKLNNLFEGNKLKFCLDTSKLKTDFPKLNEQINCTNKEFIKRMYDDKVHVTPISNPLQPHLDVYLHPSRNEGMPLSVVEAYMSKVPIVGSKAGNIPEIVEKGSGRTLKLKSSPKKEGGGFVRLLNEVIDDLSKNGPPEYEIDEDFTAEKNAQKFDDFVRRL